MFAIALGFIKPYLGKIGMVLAALLVIVSLYKSVWNSGYDQGIAKRDELITAIQAENVRLKTIKDVIEPRTIIEYRDRVVYIEKKSTKVKESIRNGELDAESNNCNIGDVFIRLHNESAAN